MSNDQTTSENSGKNAWPWFTVAITLAQIVLFLLSTSSTPDFENYHVDASSVWSGKYWGILVSCFFHVNFIHLLFNVCWLWAFGGRFELHFGSIRYIAFFVLTGFVTGAMQLAFTSIIGVGASGIGYALFGFALVARKRISAFDSLMSPTLISVALLWLVGCIIATHLGWVVIGNVAHISGVFLGIGIACISDSRKLVLLVVAALVFSVVPLNYAPWSIRWLSYKAESSHSKKDLRRGIYYYSQIIKRDPDNAWAFWNRGCAYHEIGEYEKADSDLKMAESLDPSYKR